MCWVYPKNIWGDSYIEGLKNGQGTRIPLEDDDHNSDEDNDEDAAYIEAEMLYNRNHHTLMAWPTFQIIPQSFYNFSQTLQALSIKNIYQKNSNSR